MLLMTTKLIDRNIKNITDVTEDDIILKDRIDALAAKHKNFKVKRWGYITRRKTSCEGEGVQRVGTLRTFFFCGIQYRIVSNVILL
jgi:hypothetical protein